MNQDKDLYAAGATFLTVGEEQDGQRLDNFLTARLKGLPKSRLYRLIRKGEVRVNKKRAKPATRLAADDSVRVPPLRLAAAQEQAPPSAALAELLRRSVLYEDDDLLILNKPSGLPVHGGTGVKVGLIEGLRYLQAEGAYLELAHRIDKGTSGCLMVARNSRTLKALGRQLKQQLVEKRYHAIVQGRWPDELREIDQPLERLEPQGGERFVTVSADGKPALTHFRVLRLLQEHTLVEACPRSGRTHQIRVHARCAGHPIAGDEKYSDEDARERLRGQGIKRLCLHAAGLELEHPPGERLRVEAPYDAAFEAALAALSSPESR